MKDNIKQGGHDQSQRNMINREENLRSMRKTWKDIIKQGVNMRKAVEK